MKHYFSFDCPACGHECLVDNGDPSDLTISDVKNTKCHFCKAVIKLPEFDGEDPELVPLEEIDNIIYEKTFPF